MGKYLIYFKYLTYLLIAILFFTVVDIFSRFLYEKSWFSGVKLSNEVDPMDIFGTAISATSAIWLGWYVTKKLTAQRFEKEYIISDIKKIEDELFTLEAKMKISQIDLQTVLELLNNFNLYISRFSKTIEIFQINSIKPDKLSLAYQKLYERTTNIEGTHLIIDQSVKIEIDAICTSILAETRYMICEINKK